MYSPSSILRRRSVPYATIALLCAIDLFGPVTRSVSQEIRENGTVLVEDRFDLQNGDWRGVALTTNVAERTFVIENGKLDVRLSGNNSLFAVYNTKPVTGHFYAEVEFDNERQRTILRSRTDRDKKR
jgi:hypothetical protein